MAKEKLEDLSLDKLKKRKKFGVILLCILIGVVILSIIVLLIGEKQLDTSHLIAVSSCLVCALPIYLGIKKAKGEISRRKSQ